MNFTQDDIEWMTAAIEETLAEFERKRQALIEFMHLHSITPEELEYLLESIYEEKEVP